MLIIRSCCPRIVRAVAELMVFPSKAVARRRRQLSATWFTFLITHILNTLYGRLDIGRSIPSCLLQHVISILTGVYQSSESVTQYDDITPAHFSFSITPPPAQVVFQLVRTKRYVLSRLCPQNIFHFQDDFLLFYFLPLISLVKRCQCNRFLIFDFEIFQKNIRPLSSKRKKWFLPFGFETLL